MFWGSMYIAPPSIVIVPRVAGEGKNADKRTLTITTSCPISSDHIHTPLLMSPLSSIGEGNVFGVKFNPWLLTCRHLELDAKRVRIQSSKVSYYGSNSTVS